MSLLSVDGLKATVSEAAPPCVSLYMPTHRTGTETSQDPIRLDNLLKTAVRQLQQLEHDVRTIDRILAPARALVKDAGFWPFMSDGLAILAWDGGHATHRAALPFAELCVVGSRPHVKPLLPLLAGDGRFLVLALSQNAVRLFEGGREGMRPLDTRDIPASLTDVVGYDVEQRSLQFRTPGSSTGGSGRARSAMFHGHGAGAEDQKDEIEKFLRAVDDGVRSMLNGQSVPVVLAAAEPVASMFRRVTRLPDLLADGPSGNFDHDDGRTLFDKAWACVAPRHDAARQKLADRIRAGLGTGKVVQRIEEVVAAARTGRIDAMIAATDAYRWAPDDGSCAVRAVRQPGDIDLIDFAAMECLQHGGVVHPAPAAEVPGDKAVTAAVLRF